MFPAPRGSAFLGTPSAARGPLAPPLGIESTDHRHEITLPGDGPRPQWENGARGGGARAAPRTARILDGVGTALALAETSASRLNTTIDAAAWFGTRGPPWDDRHPAPSGCRSRAFGMSTPARLASMPRTPGSMPRTSGIDLRTPGVDAPPRAFPSCGQEPLLSALRLSSALGSSAPSWTGSASHAAALDGLLAACAAPRGTRGADGRGVRSRGTWASGSRRDRS